MRRVIFVAVSALVLIFCISSCTEKAPSVPEIVAGFKANAQVDMGEVSLGCSVSHTSGGVSSVTIQKPEGLKGLSFRWLGGTYAISYNELLCETQSSYLPSNSFAEAIVNALNTASKEGGVTYTKSEDGCAVFSGSCSSGDFLLYADEKSGYITKIDFPEINTTVTFTNTEKI